MSTIKLAKLKKELSNMKTVYSKPSTSQKTKDILKKAMDKINSQIDSLESKSTKKATKTTSSSSSKAKATKSEPKSPAKKKAPLSALEKLKKRVKGKAYGAYKKNPVSDLEKDAAQPALPIGRRIAKKTGKRYYEYRANRLDVKQPPKRYPKLADGGIMAKGGDVVGMSGSTYKLEMWDSFDDMQEKKKPSKIVYSEIENNLKDLSEEHQEKDGSTKLYKKRKGKYINIATYLEDGGYMANGGEVDSFEKKVKDALKENNKWHFISEDVDGKSVQLKMFVGAKEVDVQIFKINGIHAKMPRNYSGKRDTLKMIMDNFESKMASGGKMADGGMMAKGDKFEKPIAAVMDDDGNINSEKKLKKDLEYLTKGYQDKLITKHEYDKLKNEIVQKIELLQNKDRGGYMASGGMMAQGGGIKNQYEDKSPEEIWDYMWTSNQKAHFLLDHAELLDKDRIENDLGYSRIVQADYTYKQLTPHTKKVLQSHIEKGQYADGGMMDDSEYRKRVEMFGYKPYGKTEGKYQIKYSVDGEEQIEVRTSLEEAQDAKKRYEKLGYTDVKITDISKKMADGGEVKWQDASYGDSALVVSENKMGIIIKPYGRKFHLHFVDGTEKTYDANDLKFFKEMDDYADGGMMARGGKAKIELKDASNLSDEERFELNVLKALSGFNKGLNINSLYEVLGFSNYRFGKYANDEQVNKVKSALSSLISKGYVEESGFGYNQTIEGRRFIDSFQYGSYEKGGETQKDKLTKELFRLQRQLNSSRLQTYIEGDDSEEEMARQSERKVKLERFNEILEILREADKKKQVDESIDSFADGGELKRDYLVTFDHPTDEYQPTTFQATSVYDLMETLKQSIPENVEILSIEEMKPNETLKYGGVAGY